MHEFDEKVLRAISGVDIPDLVWGAAMTVAVESLHEQGYIRQVPRGDRGIAYVCTERGREYLQKFNAKEEAADLRRIERKRK